MTTPAAPIRFCSVCKQADDHPRHDVWGTDPNVAPHLDCCASVGCPDGSCDVLIRNKGDKVGEAFAKSLGSASFAEKSAELLDARDDTTRTFYLADLDQAVHGSVQGVTELETR